MASLVRTVTLERPAKRRRSSARTYNRAFTARSRAKNAYASYSSPRFSKSFSQFFDPFPTKMRNVLRYTKVIELQENVGALPFQIYEFSANGITIPDTTVPDGKYPLGYATLNSLYSYYRVEKSSCRITIIDGGQRDPGGGQPISPKPIILGLMTKEDVAFPVGMTASNAFELKGMKKMVVRKDSVQPQMLDSFYNFKAATPGDVSDMQAEYGNLPAEQTQFAIILQSLDVNSNGMVTVLVNIDFYVTSWDLKPQLEPVDE